MTALQLLLTLRRRWHVMLLGVLATALGVVVPPPETVYWATVSVKVLLPVDEVTPKTLEDTGSDPIAVAVMLMSKVNRGRETSRSVSPDATLYGEGKRQATEARIRDVGGQWGSQVREPVIDIQAVDATPWDVERRLRDQTAILEESLTQLQDTLHVARSQRLRLEPSTTDINIWQVSGSRARSLAATGLAGLVLTLSAAYWVEMVSRRRQTAKHRQESRR